MTKKPQRLLLITILLLVLFGSSVYTILTPSAQAAEMTTQQKALTIINNVVSLDLSKYSAILQGNLPNSYLGVIPQENVRYILGLNGSTVADMRLTFANGRLRVIHVLGSTDPSRLTITAINSLEMAKDFLNTYQNYSNNSFYGQLNSMLNDVAVGKNLTKTFGNIKLEVSTSDYYNSETYSWIYSNNGVEAKSKCVTISFESGFLKYFIDNWDLYKIGSASVNISEKQAIETGMQQAKNFSWKMGSDNATYQVKNYTVANAMIWETVYLSNLYADNPRSEDPLMLYPIRHVWVSLDKFYPGNVYGMNVYIWADTGKVAYIHERVSSSDPPSDMIASSDNFKVEAVNNEAHATSISAPWIALPAFAFIAGTIPIWFLLRVGKTSKRRFSKFVGTTFCLLLFLSTFLFVTNSTVQASSPSSRMEIWGSESIGAYNQSLGLSWRKTNEEIYYQDMLGYLISIYSGDNSYDAINSQGDNGHTSFKAMILDDISYNDANYPRVAVVDFDHGNGNTGVSGIPSYEFHYCFEDNNGTRLDGTSPGRDFVDNGVYDLEIYPRVATGKVCFAFINTCNSAHHGNYFGNYPSTQGLIQGTDRARGLPFAWSHRSVYPGNNGDFDVSLHLSSNGYNSQIRDNGDFVYLGFVGGSASLNQTIGSSGPKYWEWFRDFFWFALSSDESVNDALDDASIEHYNSDFGDTDLATEFNSIWPMWNHATNQWYNSTGPGSLAVYGNGNIHLYQNGGIWNFDEGQGSTAYDSTAHHNDGTIYGASWVNGRIGSALSFADDDEVDVPSVEGLKYKGGDMTISFWVKADVGDSTRGFIISKPFNGMGVYNYRISWNTDDKITIHLNGGSQYYEYTTPNACSEGIYHYIAVVLRNDKSVKLYVDGALVNSDTHSITSWNGGEYGDNDRALTFGNIYPQEPTDSSFMFNGDLDEVRIYSYAFSAEQIIDDAAVASYHLNGGNSAYDSSPFGNTGTIYGASSASGVRGSSLSFANDDEVDIPSAEVIKYKGGDMTVSLWAKADVEDSTDGWIISKPFNFMGVYNYWIKWTSDNEINVHLDGGTQYYDYTTPSSYSEGVYHHIALTLTSDRTVKLFVDGSLVNSDSHSITSWDGGTYGDLDKELTLGNIYPQEPAQSYFRFNGDIDEVLIFNRALTSTEVAYYYSTHLPYHWIMTETLDDTYSYSIEAPFEIDYQEVGGLYSYYYAIRGGHTVSVDATIYHPYYGWYEFSYFTFDGTNPDYNNPITVTITKDTTITAHYVWYDYP